MLFNYQQYIEQYFAGNLDFARKVFCDIQRNGDGVSQMILKISLPDLPNGVKYTIDTLNSTIYKLTL